MEKDFIKQAEEEFEKIFQFLKKDIGSLRTNRATVELVSPILVDVYGTKTPLGQLGQISVLEGRTFVIEPWDKNILKSVEKALSQADLGAEPVLDEGIIRLTLPPLGEERRKRVLRLLKEKMENARQKARLFRDSIREKIRSSYQEKEITEDEKYRFFEELDKKIAELNEKIQTLSQEKEKEIMSF